MANKKVISSPVKINGRSWKDIYDKKSRPALFVHLLAAMIFPVTLPINAANVEPVDQNAVLTLNLDKSQLSNNNHYIWNEVEGGTHANYWYRSSHWVCRSTTNPVTGACSTTAVSDIPGPTLIPLTFTEQRSGIKKTLNVYGHNRRNICNSDTKAINDYKFEWCGANPGYGNTSKKLTVWISDDQIAQLDVSGRWKANLKILQAIKDEFTGQFRNVANWNADITINLQDRNNITIWFPAWPTSTPNVNLNLQTLSAPGTPGGQTSGRALLDMCLYDGFNANSASYKVLLSDGQNISGREKSFFSVFHDGRPNNNRHQRVDYRIELNYNGQQLTLNNNQPLTLTGINQTKIQSVVLPNIPHPVMCVPTPLTFITPTFSPINTQSGSYSGQVRMVFTPSL